MTMTMNTAHLPIITDFMEYTVAALGDEWESQIGWMYLDTYRKNGVPAPIITTGIGCALASAALVTPTVECLNLPWKINGSGGISQLASPVDILNDWTAIRKAPFGLRASAYASFTRCRLEPAAQEALCRSRLTTFVDGLKKEFPAWDVWPEAAKAGALDLRYGLGGAAWAEYRQFQAACAVQNWAWAGQECQSNKSMAAYAARNARRVALFQQAQQQQAAPNPQGGPPPQLA